MTGPANWGPAHGDELDDTVVLTGLDGRFPERPHGRPSRQSAEPPNHPTAPHGTSAREYGGPAGPPNRVAEPPGVAPGPHGALGEPPGHHGHYSRRVDVPHPGSGSGQVSGSGSEQGSAVETGSVARNSAIMAAGSIVSRITGFLRTAAISAAIGAGIVGDCYNLAVALPNMVFELLVGGVLSSVIVPVLVQRRKESDGGQAYAQRLLTLAVLALGAATVVAVFCAPLFAAAYRNSRTTAASNGLVTDLSYLILPAIFFYGMAALCAALLNSRGHFAAPMWAPILNNVVVVTIAGVFIAMSTGKPTPESISSTQTLLLGVGTTVGIVIQAVSLWPALRKVGFTWRWRFDFRALGLRELGRLSAWMLLFVVVSQLGLFIVLNIAKRAGERSGTGVTIFQNSFLIFMMAHGIVAVSVMTALLPRMSAAAADGRHRDLVTQMSSAIRLIAVVLVPITAAYLLLGRPMAVTLFEWGHYDHSEALATGPVIAVAGFGLLPYAIMQLQQFAFYALRDTRSPSLINIPVVALRVGIDVLFYLVLPASAVAAAMMGGSAISFAAGTAFSFVLLRKRLGGQDMRRLTTTLIRLIAAAALAAIPTFLIGYGIEGLMGTGKLASLVHLAAGGTVLIGCYFAAALLLRVREMHEVTRMVRSRLGR